MAPICETGDFFARDRELPVTCEGDLLAILDTGAYRSWCSVPTTTRAAARRKCWSKAPSRAACNPDESVRQHAHRHVVDSINIAKAVGSKALSLWFADGTNYPGQDDITTRKHRMHGALRQWHDAMPADMTMLVEYKPFEPAFYHTDIADWGMALRLRQGCRPAGQGPGRYRPSSSGANIEHIVAFLIDEGMLGGFHFNDRKYADDDLTLGSIDPYAVFRIFHEIRNSAESHGRDVSDIAYMVDQSHNLKPKIEAMIQTAMTAQELFAKACLVDRAELRDAQVGGNIVDAENGLKAAFLPDVEPLLGEWRKKNNGCPRPAGRLAGQRLSIPRCRGASSRPGPTQGIKPGGSYA